MITLLPALLFAQTPDVASLDAMAQKRDVAGLSKFLTPDSLTPLNPLQVLKTNGAYDTGRMGWHVLELSPPDTNRKFLVFTTPLTSEDIGEMVFERQGAMLKYVPEDVALGVHIAHHNLDVTFDIATKTVSVLDKVELTKTGESSPYFLLRMSPYLHVDSIAPHIQTAAGGSGPDNEYGVKFAQGGGVVALSTNEVFHSNKETSITLRYHGVDNLPQYAGSISDTEATVTNDYWYPMIARWPAPYDITVHSPKGWMAVGQGEQIGMKEDESGRTTSFHMALPVTYYSLSIAPYKMASQQDGKRKISAWSLDRSQEELLNQTEFYKPILAMYDKQFAPFPFSGYGALQSDLYGGGALEAYSFATYGGGIPYEDPHEPSHTWWGGIIDNTYLHSMWNESFADYCEGYFRRNVQIGNQKERSLAYISDAKPQQAYNTAPCESASPWYGGDASAIGYGKGAHVLQMLENELGTDTMVACMREWINENPKGSPGEWSGFEKAVANTTHKDYKWFFDEWIRRKGWAKFEVKNVKWIQGGLIGDVYFTGEPYRINCELMMQYADGSRDFVKFNTMQNKIGDHYGFLIKAPKRSDLVSIDPWRRVLRDQHDDEVPVSISSALPGARRYADPKHLNWLSGLGSGSSTKMPQDLANTFIVGTPDEIPEMALLCGKAGFKVRGNQLTYDGTTIDLDRGGAVAVLDLPGGKHCLVGLGTFKVTPNFGRARTMLFDSLGRFLRGWTVPKTSGWMTFKMAPGGNKLNPHGGPIK